MLNRKKKTQPEEPKGPYRVIAVPFGRDIEAHAASLERTINQLSADGYDMNPIEHPKGVVVIGHRKEPPVAFESNHSEQHPLIELLRGMGAVPVGITATPERDEPDPLSADTHAFFGQFMRLKPDPKKLPDTVNTLLSALPVDKLTRMADELTTGKELHSKQCSVPTCIMPALLDALIERMREHTKTRLQ